MKWPSYTTRYNPISTWCRSDFLFWYSSNWDIADHAETLPQHQRWLENWDIVPQRPIPWRTILQTDISRNGYFSEWTFPFIELHLQMLFLYWNFWMYTSNLTIITNSDSSTIQSQSMFLLRLLVYQWIVSSFNYFRTLFYEK